MPAGADNDVVAPKLPGGDTLPFPPTPSASIAGRTLQESVYTPRVVPRRLPDSAPNIVIVLIDDAGPVPYIAGWQQAPTGREDTWHLATEIFTIRRAPGRLKYLAGIESGVALWVNDIPPETAAERLREAL